MLGKSPGFAKCFDLNTLMSTLQGWLWILMSMILSSNYMLLLQTWSYIHLGYFKANRIRSLNPALTLGRTTSSLPMIGGSFVTLPSCTKKRWKRVLVDSGGSSVPGLSSAVIDHYQTEFSELEHVDYAIAPGNRFERGYATIRAILSYTGKLFSSWKGSQWEDVYLIEQDFGVPIGSRCLANIDIPRFF